MRELALFAGAGGGILGGLLLGWRTICAVEITPYAASVLIARQNEGVLPPFPIWDDVRTFDGKSWRGIVDVVSGGFPCQDISAAGKGAGISGPKSGLWKQMSRIIGEVRPRFAFVENSSCLVRRGLSVVIGDLAEMGYDATWGIISAGDIGAPHLRKRIWILAYPTGERIGQLSARSRESKEATGNAGRDCKQLDTDTMRQGLQDREATEDKRRALSNGDCCELWAVEPGMGRVVHGLPCRVDRIRCLGNAQVPAVAAFAWEMLTGK